MGDMTPADLLRRFHEDIRLRHREDEPGPGVVLDADGPVLRRYPEVPGASYAMVESPRGLGDDPDHWIGRVVDFFTGRGERVEWKTYAYDEPADLRARLTRAGFVPQDEEVLLLGEVAVLIHPVVLPHGVRLRGVDAGDDGAFRRIHELVGRVWGEDEGFDRSTTADLQREKGAAPDRLDVVVIERESGGDVLCAGWLRYTEGTGFASLWGGSTDPGWRRRGLYRATVSHRAQLAAARGYRYMRVDTSADSRPILTRRGLHAVTTTTPVVLPAPRSRVDAR